MITFNNITHFYSFPSRLLLYPKKEKRKSTSCHQVDFLFAVTSKRHPLLHDRQCATKPG